MELVFTDAAGETGSISEGVDLEYDGPWADEVARYLSEVEAACREDGSLAVEAAFGELVVGLPERTAVERVERRRERPRRRRDGPPTPPRERRRVFFTAPAERPPWSN